MKVGVSKRPTPHILTVMHKLKIDTENDKLTTMKNKNEMLTQEQMDLFQNTYEKLSPPLVYKIRLAVTKWRNNNYDDASDISKSLMNFWLNQDHFIGQNKFNTRLPRQKINID